MSYQYIHTSAKRGLEPGKSGFCCVARDREIPPDLILELEQQSRYHSGGQSSSPLVLRHRFVALRSGEYHILSRIQEAGADYSKRNNHLAHHLVFTALETAALPNPASVLLNWKGWRSQWDEPPRIFEPGESFSLQDMNTARRRKSAAVPYPKLVTNDEPISQTVKLTLGEELQLVEHIGHALNDVRAQDRWSCGFTSCLLPTDRPQDYVWRGVCDEKALPYDIDYTPRPLLKRREEARKEAPAKQSEVKTKLSAHRPNPLKQAPVVEIPEAFDRKKLKRPKRKFGDREFSRTINLAIASAAILCISLTALLFRSHEVDTLPAAEDSETGSTGATLTNDLVKWLEFERAGYPKEQLAAITSIARNLFETGREDPKSVTDFLVQIERLDLEPKPTVLVVPNSLLQFEGDTVRLSIRPESYPQLQSAALLPRQLASELDEIAQRFSLASTYLINLPVGSYSARSATDTIDTVLLAALERLPAVSATARAALQEYESQKISLQNNGQFTPYLSLSSSFALPESADYVAFDEHGLLVGQSPSSFADYLLQTFSSFLETASVGERRSPSFEAARDTVFNKKFASAYEAAEAIGQALQILAERKTRSDAPWLHLWQGWQRAFIREDLMEQTIISYTLEALESAKRRLEELRAQFTSEELRFYQSRRELESWARDLKDTSQSVDEDEEWVVISY